MHRREPSNFVFFAFPSSEIADRAFLMDTLMYHINQRGCGSMVMEGLHLE